MLASCKPETNSIGITRKRQVLIWYVLTNVCAEWAPDITNRLHVEQYQQGVLYMQLATLTTQLLRQSRLTPQNRLQQAVRHTLLVHAYGMVRKSEQPHLEPKRAPTALDNREGGSE